MKNNSADKATKPRNRYPAFVLSIVGCILLCTICGFGESQPLAGALAGAFTTAIAAAAAHFIAMKGFPGLSDKKVLNIISGLITLIKGLALSALLSFLLGLEGARMIIFALIVLVWTVQMVMGGFQTGSFPSAVLGALLGGGAYYLTVLIIPSLYPGLEGAPPHARLAFVLVGAYGAFMGASSMRAGKFGIREEPEDAEPAPEQKQGD